MAALTWAIWASVARLTGCFVSGQTRISIKSELTVGMFPSGKSLAEAA